MANETKISDKTLKRIQEWSYFLAYSIFMISAVTINPAWVNTLLAVAGFVWLGNDAREERNKRENARDKK
jgi:thiaminase